MSGIRKTLNTHPHFYLLRSEVESSGKENHWEYPGQEMLAVAVGAHRHRKSWTGAGSEEAGQRIRGSHGQRHGYPMVTWVCIFQIVSGDWKGVAFPADSGKGGDRAAAACLLWIYVVSALQHCCLQETLGTEDSAEVDAPSPSVLCKLTWLLSNLAKFCQKYPLSPCPCPGRMGPAGENGTGSWLWGPGGFMVP